MNPTPNDDADLGQLATPAARAAALEAERLLALADEAEARGDVAGAKWYRKRAAKQVDRASVAEAKAEVERRVNAGRRRG